MSAQRLEKTDLIRLFDGGSLTGLSEWQLLERFRTSRDEQAFEALVTWHGPMVMGVCRRILVNPYDAEDAFQAAFLVLLRRASHLGPADALGPWLHGVAVKVALQARGAAARRGRRERPGLVPDVPAPTSPSEDPELRRILDQEIDRLPSRYRLPIVLCYLEGQTHEQAARTLEWPLGTVKGRLARARALLESRLTRRGVACGTALAALASGSPARAAVPAALVRSTCRAAVQLGPKTVLASVVSTSVADLIQGVLSTMIVQKLKLFAVAAAVSGVMLSGVAVLARQQGKGEPQIASGLPDPGFDPPAKSGQGQSQSKKVDSLVPQPKDPNVLQQRALREAQRAYARAEQEYRASKFPLGSVYQASLLVVSQQREAAKGDPALRRKAVEDHFDRMRQLARDHQEAGDTDDADGATIRAYVAEAELLAAQARTAPPQAPAPVSGGLSDLPGRDAKSLAVLAKLEHPVAMSFPNETPLEDVLKYIKQATQGPNDTGITIYVDPGGLQEAEKTLTSPIQLDLEGVPLRRTLQLLLAQLGLVYYVDDGILVITSEGSEQNRLPPSGTEQSAFAQKRERAERGEMNLEEMRTFVEELKIRKEMMNALNDLRTRNELGGIGPPPQPNPAPTEALLKEIRDLIGQIRAEREKSRKE